MDKGTKPRINKIKPHKINSRLFGLYFIFLPLLLFSTTLVKSEVSNQIKLKVRGPGERTFLNWNDFSVKDVFIDNGWRGSIKKYNFGGTLNNVTLQLWSQIGSSHDMFLELLDIIEVDLTDFDSSILYDMSSMFNGCQNLKKITFGNINTAGVQNMYRLFFNCKSLTSIDLSNFVTTNVYNMIEIFSHCESITELDISTFNTVKVNGMYDMFAYCHNLTSIDVSRLDNSQVVDMQGMFYSCYKLKYLDITHLKSTQATNLKSLFGYDVTLEYINMSNFKILNGDETYHLEMFNEHHKNLKVCLIDLYTELLLAPQIYDFNYDCSDKCFPKTYKYDLCDRVCYEYCSLTRCKFDYNDVCYYRCPNTTYEPDDREYFCVDKVPEGSYYYNTTREVFKQCHFKCKVCIQKGGDINSNCIECNVGYIFLNESMPETFNNCYNKCPYYYYFNEINKYTCTTIQQCPGSFNKLINEKKKCIDQCKKDNH